MATPLEQLKQAYDSGDLEACEAIIQRTRSLSGEPSPEFHQLASNLFRTLDKFSEALFHDQRLIHLKPKSPIGYHRSGQDLLKLNRPNDAIEQALAGLKHSGDQHPSLHLIAQKAFRLNQDHRNSLRHAQALIQLAPDDPLGFIRAAQDLIATASYQQAKETVQVGLNNHPKDQKLLKLAIQVASLTNTIPAASKEISLLAEHYPTQENLTHCRKLLRPHGLRHKSRELSEQIASRSHATRHDVTELFVDHVVLGELDAAQQLADHTGLLTAAENNRMQSLLRTAGSISLTDQDRALLSTTNLFNQLERASFNPNIRQVLINSAHKPTIAVIHVGKCAGESILDAIRSNFSGDEIDLYEFHIFDANQRINQLLSQQQPQHQVHWLICTRNPLHRWISAFNWDTHTFHLSRQYPCHPRAHDLHQHYPSAKALAYGLQNNDSDALEYAQFHHLAYGHIAMGASWYLPNQSLQHLHPEQTSVIRTEHIQGDFDRAVQSILSQFPALSQRSAVQVPKTKQNYQTRYQPGTFSRLSDLSSAEQAAIERTIEDDISTHRALLEITH